MIIRLYWVLLKWLCPHTVTLPVCLSAAACGSVIYHQWCKKACCGAHLHKHTVKIYYAGFPLQTRNLSVITSDPLSVSRCLSAEAPPSACLWACTPAALRWGRGFMKRCEVQDRKQHAETALKNGNTGTQNKSESVVGFYFHFGWRACSQTLTDNPA